MNLTYHCKLCIPVENTILIGKVKLINMELIVALNGPIIFFLPNEYIDIEENIFEAGEYDFAILFCKNWGNLFKCIDIEKRFYYGFNEECLWEYFKQVTKLEK